MTAPDAVKAVKEKSDKAKKALISVLQQRPVIVNRAPTLHKYGMMAFWPVLTRGDTLKVNPIVTKGFGADFDGDAMLYFVPVTKNAVEEAKNMLPSKHLFQPQTMSVHYLPRMDFILGLYLASRVKKKLPKAFATAEDAIKAYKKGLISIDDPIQILR